MFGFNSGGVARQRLLRYKATHRRDAAIEQLTTLRRKIPMNSKEVRAVEEQEIDHLAKLWYEGWQDAHAQIVPAGLRRWRTMNSFRQRLEAALSETRVVGPRGAPDGFYIIKNDELYQIYVSAQARGSGAARALMADAEVRLAKAGIETAWLACSIGNDRAARFYEKCSWRRVGVITYQAEISTGTFPLKVWRYEKRLIRET
jgi:ribosomal protein S18 acetylase RimI-like enzyme